MKSITLLVLLLFAGLFHPVYAQDIFNAGDTILRWDPAQPLGSSANPNPQLPGLQKWVTVETNGITTGYGAFDAAPFKSYYIKVGERAFAFRLKYPKSYNNPDSAGKKYPVMLFFHGAGEPGCPANGGIYNNEKHLLFGAQFFMNKVNAGAYDGFLLYPQNNTTNTGCYASSWGTIYFSPIVSLLDSMEKYVRLDKDRVLADGLSAGGIAAWKIAELYPRSIAGIAPSSAVGGTGIDYTRFVHIPVWMATGEVDNNPALSTAQLAVSRMRNLGGYIKHTIYAGQGHFTWNDHWAEAGYTDFMNDVHKANPLIFFQHDGFCPGAPVNAKLGITPGYFAYEWQKDGVTIASAVRGVATIADSSSIISFAVNEITVKALGTYRVRFKRIATAAWSDWSPRPAIIHIKATTQTPEIQVDGLNSHFLPDLNGLTTVPLKLPAGFSNYQWYRLPDSTLVNTTATFNAPAGDYIARYAEPFGCGSLFSPVFKVLNVPDAAAPPVPEQMNALATSFTSIMVSWQTDSLAPYPATGFEVYRSGTAGGPYQLIAQLPAGVDHYLDDSLSINTVHYYVVRTINSNTASAPGKEVVVKTMADNIAPGKPSHLRFQGATAHSISLRWNAATDNVKVKLYELFVNGEQLYSSRDTVFTVGGLDSAATYTFTVRAVDEAGNISGYSNEATGLTYGGGLHYKYYHGTWGMLPDFNALSPEKSGITRRVDINDGIRTRNDNFGFLWEGFIYIPDDGSYTFETASDDGSKFYIDVPYSDSAVALINNDGGHATQIRSGTITLSRGYHPVAITFFEGQGQEEMRLFWYSRFHAREEIPGSVFSPAAHAIPAPAEEMDTIPPQAPAGLQYKGSSLQAVQLQWRSAADNMAVKEYNIYADGLLLATTADTSFTVTGLDSLRLYHFTVRSVDRTGNISAPSGQLTVYTHRQGLHYKYYHGAWNVLPAFSTLVPEKEGITGALDINAGIRTQDDQFAFLWEGFLFVPADGLYTFETSSDDGSKLYIDTLYNDSAVALVNNDGLHAVLTKSDTISLTRGYHRIAASFFENGGGELMEVYWSNNAGLQRARIPQYFFSTDFAEIPAIPVAPDSLVVTALSDRVVQLTWADKSDHETGFELLRSERPDGPFVPITTLAENVSSFTDSGLLAQTTYYYQLRAIGAGGESAYILDSCTTGTAPIVLYAPDGLRAALQTGNKITLSWNDNSSLEDGYHIWRRSRAATAFQLIVATAPDVNAWTDTGTAPERYDYYVTAVHGVDTSLATDTVRVFTGNAVPAITLATTILYLKTDSTSALNFSVADDNQDSLAVSIQDHPSFVKLLRTGARNYRFNFSPVYNDIGTYAVKIRARDDKGGMAEKLLTVFVSEKNIRTVYINFGHASLPAPRPWNNWVGVLPDSSTKTGLRDEKYSVTPFYTKMLQGMSTVTGLGHSTGHNTGVFPDTVLERGVRDAAATRQMLIGGLNHAMRYNLVFVGSVNEGTYAANSYACGSQKDTLVIRYNTNETGNLNNLTPNSNGELLVTISRLPGTPFIYLNGMAIEEFSPAITLMNPAKLYATPISSHSIALSWSDRSQTENVADGYELSRATDSSFTQDPTIISLPGNSTRYTDTGLASNVQYWYRIRAKSGVDYSAYSNQKAVITPAAGIYVNFNHNGTPAAAPWNNLGTTPVLAQSFPALLDEYGRASGIVLSITRPFNGENVAGVNTGSNSGVVPDNVLKSNFWTDKKQLSQFRVSGLQHKKRYSFGFIGSMGPAGWYIGNYTATYTIYGRTVYLNSWNNTSKIVWIQDVVADEYGEVMIDVSTTKDAGYGFNAGMIIFEYPPVSVLPARQSIIDPRQLLTICY